MADGVGEGAEGYAGSLSYSDVTRVLYCYPGVTGWMGFSRYHCLSAP
jgi:hypothetical protein